jgi:galactonate dehydratase
MRAVREAVGDEIDIMVDFHGRPGSVAAAMQFIRVLEPYSPLFLEEPVLPGDWEAMRQISAKANCPIATGERLLGQKGFSDLIYHKAVNIIQPDLCHCGGLSEAKKIAGFAEINYIGVAPHNPSGPIAGMAALHYDIATANFLIQEVLVGEAPWYHDIVASPVEIVDGHWNIPECVGLGIEINEKEAAKHPFEQEGGENIKAVLDDGTIAAW